jgi:hypothetical protein
MKKLILGMLLFLFIAPAWAVEVEGVNVPNQIELEGEALSLNGAGVRTKFFFDIYVGALYLTHSVNHAEAVLANSNPARVSMDILYGEVDKEKLTKGWTSGFKKNQSKASFAALEERLTVFNHMFTDLEKGDHINFDFLANGQTRVVIKGKQVGSIEGVDFQQALLAVWLGDKPADSDLKEAMLKGK